MQVNELRIGSLVYFNGKHQETGVVSGITTDLITDPKIYINDRIDIPYNLSSLRPIKINNQWLSDCGFVLQHVTTHTDGRYSEMYIKDCLWIQQQDNGLWSLFIFGYPITRFEDSQYKHQIQNTYFALTGEELNLKNK